MWNAHEENNYEEKLLTTKVNKSIYPLPYAINRLVLRARTSLYQLRILLQCTTLRVFIVSENLIEDPVPGDYENPASSSTCEVFPWQQRIVTQL